MMVCTFCDLPSLRRYNSHFFADAMFHFTCFNVDDPQDPSVGLIDGQLAIPGILLRREVFDPVVNEVCLICRAVLHGYLIIMHNFQVLQLIEEQIQRVDQQIHALLLVGGFAGSEYLKHCVQVGSIFIADLKPRALTRFFS